MLDASRAWLLWLGLRWAEPRVLVPGLNPMLALRDYCMGLGTEFCDAVSSALRLAARHRLGAPPSQLALLPAVLSVACTDLATGQPVPVWEPARDQAELMGSTPALGSSQGIGSTQALASSQDLGSTQAVVDSLVGAAVAQIDRAEVQVSERLE